jgi:hypothetical protein
MSKNIILVLQTQCLCSCSVLTSEKIHSSSVHKGDSLTVSDGLNLEIKVVFKLTLANQIFMFIILEINLL